MKNVFMKLKKNLIFFGLTIRLQDLFYVFKIRKKNRSNILNSHPTFAANKAIFVAYLAAIPVFTEILISKFRV